MNKAPLLVGVVSYCSNERAFIRPLLRNALLACDAVVLAVGERLYTGAPEDEGHLEELRAGFAVEMAAGRLRLVRYPVPDALLATPVALHNAARQKGVAEAVRWSSSSSSALPWVLLLDGDEVPDGAALGAWWRAQRQQGDPRRDIYKLANYWYFLTPTLVAEAWEDSAVLAHAGMLTPEVLAHPRERDGVHLAKPAGAVDLHRRVASLDGRPMVHHFSWVRVPCGREALKRKVANWGHARDGHDWAGLIDRAFDAVESGRPPVRDFVHGYALRRLPAPPVGLGPLDEEVKK